MNIASHMELSIMQAGKKSLKAVGCRGFSKDQIAIRSISWSSRTTGDEWIHSVVRNYPQCERSCTTVGSKDFRINEEYFGYLVHEVVTENEETNGKDV